MAEAQGEERRTAMADLDRAWDQLRGRLAELAADERRTPPEGHTSPLAQAIAHIARWEETETSVLSERRAGRDVGEELRDENEWNARWLSEDFYVLLDEAERRLDGAHAARRNALESLDEGLWETIGRASVRGGVAHYESHAADPLEFPLARAAVMKVFDERWQALRERLGALAEDDGAAGTGGVPPAAGITHVAHWDEGSAEVVRARRDDPSAPDPYQGRDQEWNARWLAEDAATEPRTALARADRAYGSLRTLLEGLDDDAWQAYGREFAIGTSRHYLSHTEAPLDFPR